MKKVLFSMVALMVSVCMISAQEVEEESSVLKSKKGTPILPQSGDYALGINAAPMINFAGQVIQSIGMNNAGAAATSPGFNQYTDPSMGNMIYLKKFTSDSEAYRLKVMFNSSSTTNKFFVQDDVAMDELTDPTDYDAAEMDLTDRNKINNLMFGVIVGKEYRRGYGRLQGFYGAEAGIILNRNRTANKFANEFTVDNPTPTTWDGSNPRTLSASQTNFSFLVNGFVGVEYFFAPKMSIGGEMYLGLAYTAQGKNKSQTETWDAVEDELVVTDAIGYTNPNTLSLQNLTGGNLFLVFHF